MIDRGSNQLPLHGTPIHRGKRRGDLDLSADYTDFWLQGLTNGWRPVIAEKFGFGRFHTDNISESCAKNLTQHLRNLCNLRIFPNSLLA